MKIAVVVLLGAPGSGKGTQAKALAKQHSGWVQISTGDLFRTEIGSGSPLGNSVKDILAKGGLVLDDTTNQVFASQVRKILKNGPQVKVLMLDGYPRTQPQALFLNEFCKTEGLSAPVVVEFDIAETTVVSRLADRLINPKTGKIYHRLMNPPKVAGICDDDGTPLVQRPDDQPETIRSRFKLYADQRAQILAVLCPNLDNLRKVDASMKPDLVEKGISEAILSALAN